MTRFHNQDSTLGEKIYYHESDLYRTPTILAGVPHAWEHHYRRGCSMLITRVCINLGVPHVVAVAANDFVQRFYMRESMIKQDRFTLCCAAVLLAGVLLHVYKFEFFLYTVTPYNTEHSENV